jgi:hypothetical protein
VLILRGLAEEVVPSDNGTRRVGEKDGEWLLGGRNIKHVTIKDN